MSEMAVFRSEVECLRAENARLMARVAELEAKPMVEKKRSPMRFRCGGRGTTTTRRR